MGACAALAANSAAQAMTIKARRRNGWVVWLGCIGLFLGGGAGRRHGGAYRHGFMNIITPVCRTERIANRHASAEAACRPILLADQKASPLPCFAPVL